MRVLKIKKNSIWTQLALASAASLFLGSCGLTQPLLENPCSGSDPFELGRRHGASGLPQPNSENQDLEVYSCVPKKTPEKREKYDVGYNAGLAEYCTKENGYNMGVADVPYNKVCPTLSEREFLLGYEEGSAHRAVHLEIQQLQQKMSSLEQDLNNPQIPGSQKKSLQRELASVKKKITVNSKKITRQ